MEEIDGIKIKLPKAMLIPSSCRIQLVFYSTIVVSTVHTYRYAQAQNVKRNPYFYIFRNEKGKELL